MIVGVNAYQEDVSPEPIDMLVIDPEVEREQTARLKKVRQARDGHTVSTRLDELKRVAATEENTMPAMLDCARAMCTEGEIIAALREVFGTYRESPVF